MLTSADINTGNQTLLWYNFENSEGTCDGCTFDETTKQVVFALEGTGAELRLDLSDTQTAATRGDKLTFTAEEPWFWRFPPMIFEEGTFKIKQDQEADLYIDGSYVTWVYGTFEVRRNESGSLVGLWKRNTNLSVEVTFNEEGQVSGYKFLKNANSTSDPSVGIEHTGSLVEGAYCAGLGFFNIDLSAVQVIDKTKPAPPKEELLPEEIKEEIPAEPLEEEVPEETKARFAPLSPASLSIDENGVLKRLKDNGDWEPIYLLACGQFAAMNSAEERNGVYYATPASGVLRTGVSGKDGMGTITAGTLERSTTDLAHELSDMIRAQHAYAANTKVLSTLDDMLTELERL
jgi:hypothetical protein